uniref:Uncharacterized protein n=1 Tax=Skeletonema marinoi TaxID=267567 RepID=A0A7S0XM92_9STRA
MTSKFKPLVLYATDFYKLSSLLVQRVLLSKPVGNLAAYKQKTKQLLLDQSRPSSASPNLAAVTLLHWDREFGLLQYYGVQEYSRRWMKSRSSSSTTSASISQATEEVGGTSINKSTNNNNVARVAFMITSEQRQKLSVNLGYTQQDIRTFKPIEALLLIENNVKKTSDDDDHHQYNFRDRLKELVDENEKLMAKQASSSSGASIEKEQKTIEKSQTISPEDAEHAHVKADVAMALLMAEKGDDQKVDSLPVANEEIVDDASNSDKDVTSAVALIDEDDAQNQGSDDTPIKTKVETAPLSVKVTPNDSTELHMKPDVAAAFIGSHLQKEESRPGVSDVTDNDEEEDGPGWYEVVMVSMDAEETLDQEEAVVALFATKKEALECVDIKKKLASGKDKRFSVRRRWNV